MYTYTYVCNVILNIYRDMFCVEWNRKFLVQVCKKIFFYDINGKGLSGINIIYVNVLQKDCKLL